MISSIDGLFIFVEMAFNNVRMAPAVRPFLPMTLPKSSLATLSSNTDI